VRTLHDVRLGNAAGERVSDGTATARRRLGRRRRTAVGRFPRLRDRRESAVLCFARYDFTDDSARSRRERLTLRFVHCAK